MKWIEICADYRCNARCIGCHSADAQGPSMSTKEVAEILVRSHQDGIRGLWFSGGEPTIRHDFRTIVRLARKIGYERVKVQTNGWMFSYREFAEASLAAGVTEVNFAVMGADATTHDRHFQSPGAHSLLLQAIGEVGRLGLPMEGDILVYRDSAGELVDTVRRFSGLGVSRFNVWLFSPVDLGRQDLATHVPRILDVVPGITAAMDLGLGDRPDFITSWHTPPCTIPIDHWGCLFWDAELDLVVANPGGILFRQQESVVEGGTFLTRCDRCAVRKRCKGLRQDYLDRFGDTEFQPITDLA